MHGMKTLKLKPAYSVKEAKLCADILKLIEANQLSGNIKVRMIVSRNGGNTYLPDASGCSIFMIAHAMESNTSAFSAKGIHLGIYTNILKPINLLSSFKSCNSLLYVLASMFYTENKFQDAIILNTASHVCEATSSNLFWITEGQILTPPLAEGCVNGVFRNVICEMFPVEERICQISDLEHADEIFLTNMGSGIRWVKRFKEREYGHSISEKIFNKLQVTFFQE
jgi:branched-chain amino acid aminotransferase